MIDFDFILIFFHMSTQKLYLFMSTSSWNEEVISNVKNKTFIPFRVAQFRI